MKAATHVLQLELTDAERETIKRAATIAGEPFGRYIVDAALRASEVEFILASDRDRRTPCGDDGDGVD